MAKLRVGVLGCGSISEIYLVNMKERFGNLEAVACADRHPERAEAKARRFGVKALSPEALIADPEIDAVLNLTAPAGHGPLNLAAIKAGKHVYSEKPLAADTVQARAILDAAAAYGLRVGCAPDTFLGGGLQTARALFDSGAIGEPFGAAAFCMHRGPEAFHPNPAFLYQPGAGPLFDLGPYFITAMVALLGPVAMVGGLARRNGETRTASAPGATGGSFAVCTPTYVSALMLFESGPIGTITATFDLAHRYTDSGLPFVQIYGSKGTMSLPDPNRFDGPVLIRRGDGHLETVPADGGCTDNCRGIGLSDMADGITGNAPHRADGRLAFHVVEVMEKALESAAGMCPVGSRCPRPEPLRGV